MLPAILYYWIRACYITTESPSVALTRAPFGPIRPCVQLESMLETWEEREEDLEGLKVDAMRAALEYKQVLGNFELEYI